MLEAALYQQNYVVFEVPKGRFDPQTTLECTTVLWYLLVCRMKLVLSSSDGTSGTYLMEQVLSVEHMARA